MYLYVPVGLAAVIVVFLIVVALQSPDFRVFRSTTMAAPAPAIFAHVNDLHRWEAWNPWGKIDPAMKQTCEGAPAGVGQIYSWVGNSQVGAGRMTISDSRPSDLVRIKCEFFKPFSGANTAELAFKLEGNQTAVTWSMSGTKTFMHKAVHLFMNMDKMVGGQYEKGLADLKAIVEQERKA